jgi:tetratricopeptide (TPR) repeat protein
MTRTTVGDFWVVLTLIMLVRISANLIDNYHPGLSAIIVSTLTVFLVPGILSLVGQLLWQAKRFRIAEEVFRLVLPWRRIACVIPVPYLGDLYLTDLFQFFDSIEEQRRYQEAAAVSDEALKFAQKRFGNESGQAIGWLINKCALLHRMGELSAAEAMGEQAMQILDNPSRKLTKSQSEDLCLMLNNLSVVLSDAGQSDKANELCSRSIELRKQTFGNDYAKLAVAYANQGWALLQGGNYEAAEKYFWQALDADKKADNKNTLVQANALNNVGDVLRRKGDLAQAEEALTESLRIRQRTLPKSHAFLGYSYNNLGRLYSDQGKFEEAKAEFEKALHIREAISANHPDVAVTLNDFAALLHKMGNNAEAEKLEKRSREITERKSSNKAAGTQKNPARDWPTTLFIRTTVVVMVIVGLLPAMLVLSSTRPPENVPDGLSAARYYDLGVQYKQAGWIEKARDCLTRASKLDPNGKMGISAARYLKTKVPRYSQPEDAIQMNIQAYNEFNKDEKAKLFEQCIAKYPNFEWPYLNLGAMYLQMKDTAKAKEYLNKTLAINPCSTEAWTTLALVKQEEKDFAGAKECISKALELDPDDDLAKLFKYLPDK